jgi:hypothetical protein
LRSKLLNTAERIAHTIWNKGLAKTGANLSHGIAGNAYMLHCLSRAFQFFISKDPLYKDKANLWRFRSYMFAKALCDTKIVKYERSCECGLKITKGLPDYPFSLMDGLAGEICLLSDLLRDEDEVRFPGLEV